MTAAQFTHNQGSRRALRADQRGSGGVSMIVLVCALALGGAAAVKMMAAAVDSRSDCAGQEIQALRVGGTGCTDDGAAGVPASIAQPPPAPEAGPAEPASDDKPEFDPAAELLAIAADIIGLTDAKKCVMEGDIVACVMTALSFTPGRLFGMVFKLAKNAKRIKNAVERFLAFKKAKKAEEDARKAEEAARKAREADEVVTQTPRKFCFPAGTAVHTPYGQMAIEEVEAGDSVLAYDVERGEVVVRRVEDTSTSWTEHLFDVELSGDVIASTGGHLYWEESSGSWITAAELEPGMVVRLESGGTDVVRNVREQPGLVEVYNFEVASEHNYFVGESGVLVHNGGPDSFDDFNQARNAALKWLEERGFKAEAQVLGKFGPNAGKPIGMSTADGRVGFRVEFDERNGAHINVFDHNAPKGSQKGPHFTFKGDENLVNKIVKQFGC